MSASSEYKDPKKNPLYNVWRNMKRRCTNPNTPQFKDWGGRGITVCAEWKEFAPFEKWAIENGYNLGLTLDRIDNDKSYFPKNCRWVTQKVNCRNRRTARFESAFGEKKSLADWADDPRCVVKYATLFRRLFYYGWPAERAIGTPAQ